MSGTGSRCLSDFSCCPVMFFPDGAPSLPPLSPPPLSTPAGVERGAWMWFRVSGYASTAREVALPTGAPRPQGNGRRELHTLCTPRLAAAPASNETGTTGPLFCLAHGRPHSGRRRWHTKTQLFTTTAGQQSRLTSSSGGSSFHRSLSRKPEAKSRLPSLPPAGGTQQRRRRCVPIRGNTARTRDRACLGRGDEWGVVQRLARENIRGNQ
jgi:hypothetical protein